MSNCVRLIGIAVDKVNPEHKVWAWRRQWRGFGQLETNRTLEGQS